MIDLQVHSTIGSPDSYLSIESILSECLEVGIDGVALTEHSPCFHRSKDFEDAGLLLVPAREVTCAGAHILVLCADQEYLFRLPKVMTPAELSDAKGAFACIWAHPAATAGSSVYSNLPVDPAPLVDILSAIEILNGRHLHFRSVVETAIALTEATGIKGSGGSDAHKPGEVGRCVTKVASAKEAGPQGVIAAMNNGDFEAVLNHGWIQRWGNSYREDLLRFVG